MDENQEETEERIKDFVMDASKYDKLRLEQTIRKEFPLSAGVTAE